jgi:hypothetical protein
VYYTKHNFGIIHNMTSASMCSASALSFPKSRIFIHITKKFPTSQSFCHNSLCQLVTISIHASILCSFASEIQNSIICRQAEVLLENTNSQNSMSKDSFAREKKHFVYWHYQLLRYIGLMSNTWHTNMEY